MPESLTVIYFVITELLQPIWCEDLSLGLTTASTTGFTVLPFLFCFPKEQKSIPVTHQVCPRNLCRVPQSQPC